MSRKHKHPHDRKEKAKQAKAQRRSERKKQMWAKQGDEVSPWVGGDPDEVLANTPEALKKLRQIRYQKNRRSRALPSARLIIIAAPGDGNFHGALLDRVAQLVDKNAFGRSEMCTQFAVLLARALNQMGISARAVHGNASYQATTGGWKTWTDHAWVVTERGELIDGNIDSVSENPVMGDGLRPNSFWGPVDQCPVDRRFPTGENVTLAEGDVGDVENWWNQLREWMTKQGLPTRNSPPSPAPNGVTVELKDLHFRD